MFNMAIKESPLRSGKLLRFCIAGKYKNQWRNCIYHDIIGVFGENEICPTK